MWEAMKPVLIITMLGVLMAGCGNNPVSPSDTQSSGSLQYTFSTPNATYRSGDTLTAAITVHNSGSVADTIGVDASFFTWALVNSSGDTVMKGGGAAILGELVPVAPGQSTQIDIYSMRHVLIGASGQPLPSGSYSLEAKVRSMSFLIKLSVQ